jgi:hypothetical protein
LNAKNKIKKMKARGDLPLSSPEEDAETGSIRLLIIDLLSARMTAIMHKNSMIKIRNNFIKRKIKWVYFF